MKVVIMLACLMAVATAAPLYTPEVTLLVSDLFTDLSVAAQHHEDYGRGYQGGNGGGHHRDKRTIDNDRDVVADQDAAEQQLGTHSISALLSQPCRNGSGQGKCVNPLVPESSNRQRKPAVKPAMATKCSGNQRFNSRTGMCDNRAG